MDDCHDNCHGLSLTKGRVQKKSREYNEFGTKGGRVSDLNHYFKQL